MLLRADRHRASKAHIHGNQTRRIAEAGRQRHSPAVRLVSFDDGVAFHIHTRPGHRAKVAQEFQLLLHFKCGDIVEHETCLLNGPTHSIGGVKAQVEFA